MSKKEPMLNTAGAVKSTGYGNGPSAVVKTGYVTLKMVPDGGPPVCVRVTLKEHWPLDRLFMFKIWPTGAW